MEMEDDREIFIDESELGVGDLAIAWVVVEGELQLGKTMKQLAGDFVEKAATFAVELGEIIWGLDVVD